MSTVLLRDATLSVEPGAEAALPVAIRNTGQVVDDFTVELVGDARAWATVEPPVLPLFPGQEGEVLLRFHPPRSSRVPAGTSPFAVRVVSREDPAGVHVEEGTVTVAPFVDVSPEIGPVTSRARRTGRHKVVVHNDGNTPVSLAATAVDPDHQLDLKARPPQVTVPPGASRTVKVRARAGIFLRGAMRHRPFRVHLAGEGLPPTEVAGAFQQRSLLAGWTVRLGILGLLLLLLLAFLAIKGPKVLSNAAHSGVQLVTPTDFRSTPVGDSAIRLSWSGVNTATVSSFNVREVVGSGAQDVKTAKGGDTTTTITGLAPSSEHCYEIQATNPASTSPWSAEQCSRTLPAPGGPPPPSATQSLLATVLDAGDIRVSWASVTGATGYRINDFGQLVASPGPGETTHQFTGLQPGSQHCYTLQVVGPGGASAPTPQVCATTTTAPGPTLPVTPTDVAVTQAGAGALQITWTLDDPNDTASGVQVFEDVSGNRSTPDGSPQLLGSEPAGSTSYTASNLVAGQQYCFQVRSTNGTLNSPLTPTPAECGTTATVSAATMAAQPTVQSFKVSHTTLGQPGGQVTIGEEVTYQLTFTVPGDGVRGLALTDVLPAGMAWASTSPTSSTVSGQVTPSSPALSSDLPGGLAGVVSGAQVTSCAGPTVNAACGPADPGVDAGRILQLNFGDVTNSSTSVSSAQTITVAANAWVLDDAAVVTNGAVLADTAAFSYTSTSGTPGTLATPPVTLVVDAPNLSLSGHAGSGGSVTWTVAAPTGGTTPSTSVAYDPMITVTLPGLLPFPFYFESASAITCSSCTAVPTTTQIFRFSAVFNNVGPAGTATLSYVSDGSAPLLDTATLTWSSVPNESTTASQSSFNSASHAHPYATAVTPLT